MNELPHNLDAERATLGSVLLNRDSLVAVANWLTPDMFFSHKHADIYSAMLHLFAERTPPDLRTVSDELRRRGQLERVGGVAYISDLTDAAPSSYHIISYAKMVESAAMRRTLIANSTKAAALAYDESMDDDAVRAEVLALITEAAVKLL